MKAALFTGPYKIEMVERDIPILPDENTVTIKVKACGICGSDIEFYRGIPDPYVSFPYVVGHEIAGEVYHIKNNGNGLKVGDKVVTEITLNCGKCYACSLGKYNCCSNMRLVGSHVSGGFAEYVTVPAERVYKVPDDMPFDMMAMVEPFSIGANVVKRLNVIPSDKVVIHGMGTIGLTILDWVKMKGASALVTDIHEKRLARAKEFGADVTVNASQEDVTKKIMEWTDGMGATAVADASGAPDVISAMPDQVANGGRVLMVGITGKPVSFTGVTVVRKELTILGSRNSTGVFPSVIDAVYRGKTHARNMISKKFPFDRISEAFKYSVDNFSDIIKVIVEM